jgi:hypothetical protein
LNDLLSDDGFDVNRTEREIINDFWMVEELHCIPGIGAAAPVVPVV